MIRFVDDCSTAAQAANTRVAILRATMIFPSAPSLYIANNTVYS